jgi:hypothetical protein
MRDKGPQPAALVPEFSDDWHHALRRCGREVRDVVTRADAELRADGIELPHRGDSLPLTPAAVSGKWARWFDVRCQSVFRGIELLVANLFGGDTRRVADFLRLTHSEQALLGLGPQRVDWAIVARPDVIIADGRTCMIETNVTTSVGLLESGLLARILLGVPALAEVADRFGLCPLDPAEALTETVAASITEKMPAFVVVTDWRREMDDNVYLYRYLCRLLERRGVRAEPAPVEDLDVRPDGVYLDNRRIGVLYRYFTTIALRDPSTYSRYAPLLDAVNDGRVRLFGGFEHKLYTPKLLLALLSDEVHADPLPATVRQHVASIVPWTRIVAERWTSWGERRVDLMDFASRNREALVLKPDLGFGGDRVCVGAHNDQGTWDRLLSTALAAEENWLLQEYVDGVPAELAFIIDGEIQLRSARVDYGVFTVCRRFAGMARRNTTAQSGQTLTNLSRGGGLGPTLLPARSRSGRSAFAGSAPIIPAVPGRG